MISSLPEYDQPHESQTNKDILENIHRKGLGGPDSPDNDDAYHIGDDDHSPRNDNQTPDYNNLLQQRNQLNLANMTGALQQPFSISAMTNNYRDQGLMNSTAPGHQGPNPVIRMLDMSGQTPGGYQSQEHSPRDSHSNSPPSLQIPGHAGSSKDVSPVESPHSHSPPGPQHPHQLHLQPAQLHIPSPHKSDNHFTPMTTMSVPGFPPNMSSVFSQAPHQPDPFSALGQLGQDLRLNTPHHITQWLQQAQPQPPSPVKNEPMSPRSAAEARAQNNYAAL